MAATSLNAPPAQAHKPDWARARRAARALLDNPQSTQYAFEVIDALDPDRYERGLKRLLSHPEGRRLVARRPDLRAALVDRDVLARLPAGSFGRAYFDHIERWGLMPTKLAELQGLQPDSEKRGGEEEGAADADVAWYAMRHTLGHDLRHVLTGYGADQLGETALLWFSFGLEGGRSNALLMTSSARRMARAYGWRVWGMFLKAFWRGRRAKAFFVLPFEELLAAPLAEVRASVGLAGVEPR
ncbi:MAG: Coq4 family protein [Maricaulaceae bacterium]|jgi:ubiquinone biosynthesis protein COQ4